MKMATDEEIAKFVNENKELVEKMMSMQKDNLQRTAELGKEMTIAAVEATVLVAEYARHKSEEFIKASFEMLTSPEVQKHFITAGMEVIAGLSMMATLAPVPSIMKGAVTDIEKNIKQTACRNNEDCPVKTHKTELKLEAAEEC